MSSNDSMSSSRLSQFGLYRTIDARTEEFLKLSRKRQIRQGCACAAVSTAVTVTVVVSILFLYGYGVSSSTSASLRTPSWLDLMNDSTDSTPFDDKFQNSIKLDRASMNLLPVFFDKLLDDPESSSQKYEVPTEMNYKRSLFSGSTNPFISQAKAPSPSLYSIQYKTYPVLYIQSPRNTEYYMKVRKTREYERIMSYIDKMINEKVGIGTRSMRNLHYPTTTEKYEYTEDLWTVPMAVRKTSRVLTKPKESKSTKIILHHSNKNPKQLTLPNMKFNNTMIYQNKNCKCRNHFGTLLDKILNCIQELVKDPSDLPCNRKTSNTATSEIKIQNTEMPSSTFVTSTTSIRPVSTTTTGTTSTTTTTKPTTTTATTSTTAATTTTTPNIATETTLTDIPTEVYHFSNSFVQKPAIPIDTRTKSKELLSQMSPFYIMTGNNIPKHNIQKSNILAPIKPKPSILANSNQKSKLLKTQQDNQQNFSFLITEKNIMKSLTTTSTTTTTTENPERSEEIFQNLLFPETKEREYERLPPKAIKKYSTDYVLRPKSHERVPPVIKPYATTKTPPTTSKPPPTSTSLNFIQYQINKNKQVNAENLMGTLNNRPFPPISPTNNRPFSGITPEDYIMERLRGGKKQNTNKQHNTESVTVRGNKHDEKNNTNYNVFEKIKNLLKKKLMQPRRKTTYNSMSSQAIKSKTEPKYVDDKQNNAPQKFNLSTEKASQKYFESLRTPYASTTTLNRIVPPTTQIPSAIESSTSPTQLRKYSEDQFIPEITTQPLIKESNYYTKYPKLGRRNIPYNSREDVWADDDVYKTALYDTLHADGKTTTTAPKNNSVLTTATSTIEDIIDVITSPPGYNKIQRASVHLNKLPSTHNENSAWDTHTTQPDDTFTSFQYAIPVGRKSYLEISRGDWRQKEPHTDDTLDDAFDDMDGV